jgi:hypothetical protein
MPEPDLAAGRYVLRFVLGEISKRVDALERQMNRELHGLTTDTEQLLEVTGRRGTAENADANGRGTPELVPEGRSPR